MGVALICAGAVVWAGTTFWLRTRAPMPVVTLLLVASGAAVGVGALLVQEDVSTLEWVLTPAVLGLMAGLQSRMMLGPFGKPAQPSGTVSPRR